MGPSAWFGHLSVPGKARVIAAVCAVAGVLMGFVVYIVFAHTFEQGEVVTRLLALVVGLAVAMGVARLGEWLWETIATGEAEFQGQGKKAFSTAVFLIVVFELCASTVEDFAKIAIGGEFETIQRIAARVAGVDETQNRIGHETADLPALLERLRAHAKTYGLPADWKGTVATTPEGRLIQSMSLADRLTILGGAVEPTSAQLDALFAESPRRSGLLAQFDRVRLVPAPECAPELLAMSPGLGGGRSLEQILSDDPEKRALWDRAAQERIAARNAACAGALTKIGQDARIDRMLWAVNVALGRHDFYAAEAFPDAKPKPLTKTSAVSQVRSANLSLLREALPGIIKPARVLWGDFAILIAVWCAAAVALSLLLTQGVFEIPIHGGMFERLVPALKAAVLALLAAAGAMGATVLAIRLAGYMGDLMFGGTPEMLPLTGILGILNFVPWTIREISALEIFGWHPPGWLILPIVVLFLLWLIFGNDEPGEGLGTPAAWALAGLVIMSVLPVLPGTLGLMLIVGVTWIVPAFGLAVLLPYLEPGAKVPRLWGLIALGVGLGLGVWAALRFSTADPLSEAVLIATAAFLAATGALVFREIAVKDLWPLLTVTVAFCLVGGTSVWQDATFKGALNQLHPLVERKANQEPAMFDYVVYGVPKVDGVAEPEPDPETVAQARPEDGVNEAARLELALVGSLGFWLTIALLAAWSLRRKNEGLAQTGPPV